VRRIEALTGAAAEAYLSEEEELLRQAAGALRTSPAELPARLARLVDEHRRLERELAEARRALATGVQSNAGQAAAPAAAKIGDVSFDGRVVDDVPGRELRSLADDLKRRIGSGVVAIVSRDDGKAAIVVGVTDDLTPRFDAVGLVRTGAEILGGKGGGGRADMAQAGGPDAARAEEALEAVRRALAAQANA
jgi:alanyl-tRNA synthetase